MLEGRIVKKRGHLTVDICFQCKKGELLVLTGPSGAGKTTIIRMLAGLEKPDKGIIAYNKTIWFDSDTNIIESVQKRRVGYVFQEHSLFPHLNIAKNVGFSCSDKSRVVDLLEIMRIGHLASRMPQQVSGGERQRAALAQALASEPRVLLLDEPFSALDTATRVRLRRELKMLKTRLDIPIILVTHDHQEAVYLADKIINVPCAKPARAEQFDNTELFTSGLFYTPAS